VREGEPIPDEDVEAAETEPTPPHQHDREATGSGSLAQHLRRDHDLDTPEGMSDGTLEGLHDRFHSRRHAADE
jgi:hypothetical protein